MTDDMRDKDLPHRLLTAERDVFIPLLRRTAPEAFALRTAGCPDWTVRQVLAHCQAVLARVIEGRLEPGVFSPASNAADVAERDAWPLERLVDELEAGMTEAGPAIAAHENQRLRLVALGEWVHAGDVRDTLGEPGAYAAADDAVFDLLAFGSRGRKGPLVHAELTDRAEPLVLGVQDADRAPARLVTDTPTLIRLYAGRPLNGAHFELTGAEAEELNIFG
ncbi:maleylpyruvate isomerase family mycothiol-dependent enzyme [Streptomyces sp. NPDC020379]|uniref:maleylpyruvate isomerase family mycothiol-dependent enzyme n=1 Tax=Streptomyces sp. NPDC020379 TaxID=3365071 RepID=UPI003799F8B9